jgi:hypothetical protein
MTAKVNARRFFFSTTIALGKSGTIELKSEPLIHGETSP